MKNKEVAQLLYEIADLLDIQGVEWKPRAYREAADSIEALPEPIEEVHSRGELEEIDNVGESIAAKIAEYLDAGELQYYEELREDLPMDTEALTAVEGLGPRKVRKLYDALGVENLDDLEEAAEQERIATVEGFGERSQQRIKDHIQLARQQQDRMLLGEVQPLVTALAAQLEETGAFNRIDVVGSYRRRNPTVGDIDVLATAGDPEAAMDAFVTLDNVEEVLGTGETKSSVRLANTLRVDLRIVDADAYGAAKLYFTGSKNHNVALRRRASANNQKLNEYGLHDSGRTIAGTTETDIYNKLGLAYIPPELREDTGEIDAAAERALPDLVEEDDIKGDLQMHTSYSDGGATVREMAEKADELGYAYILITDHGPSLQIANGVNTEEMQAQREEISDINADDGIDVTVLHGIEANITAEELDVTAEQCERFDLVVAALHGRLSNATGKVLTVLDEYPVDILAHPLNRLINERVGIDLDMDRVAATAADNDVALEINAQPERFDLPWRLVKEHRDTVDYVVSTDAHAPAEMGYMRLGVSQARRGWLESEDVLNTRSLEEMAAYFNTAV